jgi:hypothetical protein
LKPRTKEETEIHIPGHTPFLFLRTSWREKATRMVSDIVQLEKFQNTNRNCVHVLNDHIISHKCVQLIIINKKYKLDNYPPKAFFSPL